MAISVSARDRRDLNQIFKLMAASLSYNWSAFEAGDGLGDVIVEGIAPLTDLASVLINKGASLVGIYDTGGIITATTVEAALQEIATTAIAALPAASAKLPPTPSAAGKTLYDNGTAYVALAAGTSGMAYLSGGAGAPSWGTVGLVYGGTAADLSAVAANRIFASPASGGAGNFASRLMVGADMPATCYGSAQSLSGAAAADVVTSTTYLTSTAAGQAVTLADGSFTGHRKMIKADSGYTGANSTTITPANGTAVVFATNSDWVEYEWNGAAWAIRQKFFGLQLKQITLVAGTLSITTGITVRSATTTRIWTQMRTPGGVANGVAYKLTNQTAGAPGTGRIDVTAAGTDGTTVMTDVSVLDVLIQDN